MIIWALLRQFWPYLAAIALAVGAWAWHTGAVDDAFDAGKAEVQGRWNEADRVAVEVGAATSKLLARNAIKATERYHEKLAGVEQKNKDRAVAVADAIADADELYNDLKAARAAPSRADSCPAARSYEADLGICRELLADGLKVASESRRLAAESQAIIERAEARLSAMQEWAVIVQSANEAP
jgi:hypothetical protein